MSSQLNMPSVDYNYKEFLGGNAEQMQLLLSGKDNNGIVVDVPRVPISVFGVMEQRIVVFEFLKLASNRGWRAYRRLGSHYEVVQNFTEIMENWFDKRIDTCDGVVRHSDGRLKVVLDAQYLRQLTHDTKLVDGAVPLSDDVYRGLSGEEFSSKQVGQYFNKPLSRGEAKQHPVWLSLLRGDQGLLNMAVNVIFSQANGRLGGVGKMMGIYTPSAPKEGASGRLWSVCRLDDYINYSRANGSSHLDDLNGRLVGVAPEAPRAATLERRV